MRFLAWLAAPTGRAPGSRRGTARNHHAGVEGAEQTARGHIAVQPVCPRLPSRFPCYRALSATASLYFRHSLGLRRCHLLRTCHPSLSHPHHHHLLPHSHNCATLRARPPRLPQWPQRNRPSTTVSASAGRAWEKRPVLVQRLPRLTPGSSRWTASLCSKSWNRRHKRNRFP